MTSFIEFMQCDVNTQKSNTGAAELSDQLAITCAQVEIGVNGGPGITCFSSHIRQDMGDEKMLPKSQWRQRPHKLFKCMFYKSIKPFRSNHLHK